LEASDDNPLLVTLEHQINLNFSSLGNPSASTDNPLSDKHNESKSVSSEEDP
jgi:hypothetical protein